MLVTLQDPLFGAHRTVLAVRWVLKRIDAVFVRSLSRRKEVEPVKKEKDIDSLKLTTDIDKDKTVRDEGNEKEKRPS